MRYPEEPHTLVDGVAVHVGAVWLLKHLQASGHRVALADGAIVVEPDDLPEETAALLEALDEDLTILLGAGGVGSVVSRTH